LKKQGIWLALVAVAGVFTRYACGRLEVNERYHPEAIKSAKNGYLDDVSLGLHMESHGLPSSFIRHCHFPLLHFLSFAFSLSCT
jgi:hypothetical protein